MQLIIITVLIHSISSFPPSIPIANQTSSNAFNLINNYNHQSILKDQQYFQQPSYFTPLMKINTNKYYINQTNTFPFLFLNPADHSINQQQQHTNDDDNVVVIGELPKYEDVIKQFQKTSESEECGCGQTMICDCDSLIAVPLKLNTIVLPMMRPINSVNQKPKILHNINKVQIDTNYNRVNELDVNTYIDNKKQESQPTNSQKQFRFKSQSHSHRSVIAHRLKKKQDQSSYEVCQQIIDQLNKNNEQVSLQDYIPPVHIVTKINQLPSLKSYSSKHNFNFVTVIPKHLIQRIVPASVYQQKFDHYEQNDETITSVFNQAIDNTKKDAVKKNMFTVCNKKGPNDELLLSQNK